MVNKNGRWIVEQYKGEDVLKNGGYWGFTCPDCGDKWGYGPTRYCPFCGHLIVADSDDPRGENVEDRWIPVTERLPEPKTEVIVAYDDGEVWAIWQNWAGNEDEDRLVYYKDDWQSVQTVTHWRPLPEPPKEET